MFRITSIILCTALFLFAVSRSVEESEEIGHGLRLDSNEEIGHGLRLDKRAVDSEESMNVEDTEVEELVGHGINSNHAWRK